MMVCCGIQTLALLSQGLCEQPGNIFGLWSAKAGTRFAFPDVLFFSTSVRRRNRGGFSWETRECGRAERLRALLCKSNHLRCQETAGASLPFGSYVLFMVLPGLARNIPAFIHPGVVDVGCFRGFPPLGGSLCGDLWRVGVVK